MRTLFPFVVIALFMRPDSAWAQAVHADDVEVIPAPQVEPGADPKKPDLQVAVKSIIEKTNEFRKQEGKAPVVENNKLMETARYFADYMAINDRYGHTADETRPADRAKKHGYEYCIVLENIAYQYSSAGFTTDKLGTKFFDGWKNSPGHRRNMLDADVTESGVAIARSENTGYYYAVQLFGRPKSQSIEFQISNRSLSPVTYQLDEETFTLEPRYIRTHTRCRPPQLSLQASGEAKEVESVKPATGERFVVVQESGRVRIKKE